MSYLCSLCSFFLSYLHSIIYTLFPPFFLLCSLNCILLYFYFHYHLLIIFYIFCHVSTSLLISSFSNLPSWFLVLPCLSWTCLNFFNTITSVSPTFFPPFTHPSSPPPRPSSFILYYLCNLLVSTSVSSLPLFLIPWLYSLFLSFFMHPFIFPFFPSSLSHSHLLPFFVPPFFHFFLPCLPNGVPVVPLFTLWHHPVPSAAGLCHSSGAGCLRYILCGQETGRGNLSSKPCLLQGVRDSLIGFCYHSNSTSRMANLGPYWLKPASHPLPSSAVRGL